MGITPITLHRELESREIRERDVTPNQTCHSIVGVPANDDAKYPTELHSSNIEVTNVEQK